MPQSPYNDLSSVTEEAMSSSRKKERYNFPVRLHYALEEMEKDGHHHVASWMPHGRSFKVHRTQQFEKEFLSKWFCQTKYHSFQRQLNIYGFTRIKSGPDKGSYYHEAFLYGKRFLASQIPCVKVKRHMQVEEKSTDIDFYRFTTLTALPSPAPALDTNRKPSPIQYPDIHGTVLPSQQQPPSVLGSSRSLLGAPPLSTSNNMLINAGLSRSHENVRRAGLAAALLAEPQTAQRTVGHGLPPSPSHSLGLNSMLLDNSVSSCPPQVEPLFTNPLQVRSPGTTRHSLGHLGMRDSLLASPTPRPLFLGVAGVPRSSSSQESHASLLAALVATNETRQQQLEQERQLLDLQRLEARTRILSRPPFEDQSRNPN